MAYWDEIIEDLKRELSTLRAELAKAREDERERCAKVCKDLAEEWIVEATSHDDRSWYDTGKELRCQASGARKCAAGIRALADPKAQEQQQG